MIEVLHRKGKARDGYINYILKCSCCGVKKKMFSYGNGTGLRYGRIYAESAINEFKENHKSCEVKK